MVRSFGNMKVLKKVNYLLRIYDLFIKEHPRVTPKWPELKIVEHRWGKQINKSFPPGGALTVRFSGGDF